MSVIPQVLKISQVLCYLKSSTYYHILTIIKINDLFFFG